MLEKPLSIRILNQIIEELAKEEKRLGIDLEYFKVRSRQTILAIEEESVKKSSRIVLKADSLQIPIESRKDAFLAGRISEASREFSVHYSSGEPDLLIVPQEGLRGCPEHIIKIVEEY